MALRIAINGYGRIGRSVLRALYERQLGDAVQLVAINDLADPVSIAHLTRFDSTHGRFKEPVDYVEGHLRVGEGRIQVLHEAEPSRLPWRQLDVDIVLECSGVLSTRDDAGLHLDAGANKVLYSHPAAPDVDATIIYGINHDSLKSSHRIVSNGSCTTNCIVPVIATLDEAFTITRGAITTIHSAMHDQPVIDAHHTNLRLARSAMQSIIPVDTKLAKGIVRILPHFEDRFEAIAVRVPTVNVTAMDLSITIDKAVTLDDVNQLLRRTAQTALRGVMDYTEEPVVSVDFNHDSHSTIIDGSQTRVSDGHLVKVLAWCDNEWGFANRMLDTALAMSTANQAN